MSHAIAPTPAAVPAQPKRKRRLLKLTIALLIGLLIPAIAALVFPPSASQR